jgi:hypothetical protein
VNSNTLTLETKRTSTNNDMMLGEQLRRVLGVRDVMTDTTNTGEWTRWRIRTESHALDAVRAAIAELTLRLGVAVREFRREGTSLEDVFMNAVDSPLHANSRSVVSA